MNAAFDTEPYPAQYWVYVVGVGIAAMLLVEVVAAVQRRFAARRSPRTSFPRMARLRPGREGKGWSDGESRQTPESLRSSPLSEGSPGGGPRKRVAARSRLQAASVADCPTVAVRPLHPQS